VPWDASDKMARLMFCREYDIDESTEKRARTLGWPWPPFVVLGNRVFYSREMTAQWFAKEAEKSLAAAVSRE
jgi:hypothetical protein